MKTMLLFVVFAASCAVGYGRDLLAEMKQQDRERAAYWTKQGYAFDPSHMSAIVMDMKVQDIQRAKYWEGQGYHFDPAHMSAIVMDMKVEDYRRAKYWEAQGYHFDPSHMSAIVMDMKVEDVQRSKYWAQQGYQFDPSRMSAIVMDMKVQELRAMPVRKAVRIPDDEEPIVASNTYPTRNAVAYQHSDSASQHNSLQTYPYRSPAVSVARSVSPGPAASVYTGAYSRYYDYSYRPPVGDHYVTPHIRTDGAYVQGHYKTDSDDSFWNNYSSKGNLNPHTSQIGTKTPSLFKLPSPYRLPSLPKLSRMPRL